MGMPSLHPTKASAGGISSSLAIPSLRHVASAGQPQPPPPQSQEPLSRVQLRKTDLSVDGM